MGRIGGGVLGAVLLASLALRGGLIRAAPARSPESRAPEVCTKTDGTVAAECAFYPRVAAPKLYASRHGDEPLLIPGLENRDPPDNFFNDYVADPGDLAATDPEGRVRLYSRWQPIVVWVKRGDIVRRSDLKRVVRCWPIARLAIANGDDEEGWIVFKKDGAGVVSNPGEARLPVHAWYFEGVYSVREDGNRNPRTREWAWGSIDLEARRVVDRANWGSSADAKLIERTDTECRAGVVTER